MKNLLLAFGRGHTKFVPQKDLDKCYFFQSSHDHREQFSHCLILDAFVSNNVWNIIPLTGPTFYSLLHSALCYSEFMELFPWGISKTFRCIYFSQLNKTIIASFQDGEDEHIKDY